jgi:hypothetical protein
MMTATDEERRPMLKGRSVYESNDDKNDDDFDAGTGGGDDATLYLDHQGERRSVGKTCQSAASPTRVPGATASNAPAAAAGSSHPNPHPVSSKGSPSSPSHSSPGSDPTTTVESYLHQFQVRAVECVANAYDRSNCVSRTRANGALGTSLPEDVVFLFETQLSVLQEFLRNQPAPSSISSSSSAGTTIIARINDDDNTANHEPSSLWETARGQELYCDATLAILECLIHTQKCVRPVFLSTLEHCCEAANDFVRLSDKMEQLLASFELAQAKDDDDDNNAGADGSGPNRVATVWNEYVALLAQDAVGAAERTHVFVIRDFVAWHQHGRHRRHPPRGRFGGDNKNNNVTTPATLFSYQWEVECTNNEIITSLLEDVCDRDYWSRIRRYLDADVLRNKALVALCRAVVCYYVRCLVERADSAVRGRHQNHQMLRRRAKEVLGMGQRLRGRQGGHHGGMGGGGGGFLHSGRALRRMKDDIAIIKQYFVSKAHGNTTLTRILSNEVYILELIHECLEAASDLGQEEDRDGGSNNNSNDSDHLFLDSFIVVIHKRTGGDALVTRHFVGDLFLLVNHQERPLQLTVLQQDLHLVTMRMEEVKRTKDGAGGDPKNAAKKKKNSAELSLVSVDQMLRAMYEDRIVQGMLPLCWTCLPKVEAGDGGMELVSAKIREITRGVADLRMKRKSSF